MKILYSLPHPSHRLDTPGAGHTVRANALLTALESLGCEVIRDQAAQGGAQSAAKTYRQIIKKLIPRPIALKLRDRARVAFGERYGQSLTEKVHQHKPDVILQTHIAYSLSGKIAAEATGVPLVLDDVAPSWEEDREYGSGNAALARRTHKAVTDCAGLCVAVCGPMQQFLIEDGIAPEKLIIVQNGFKRDAFHAEVNGQVVRRRYGIPLDATVIVFVGSFQPYHHVDWLVEAFEQLADVDNIHLLLVGDGSHRTAVENTVNAMGLATHVTFTGAVRYADVPQHIATADIAVIPAHAEYTNPMKLYEYMAMGCATVAPDQETITEIGTPNHDLLTFEPENVRALANSLRQLVANSDLRASLGAQGRATIADAHTWRNRAETLLAAMEKLC